MVLNVCICHQGLLTSDSCFQISEVDANGIDMIDVKFVLVTDSPLVMAEGNWKVGEVVNENCSDDQKNAIGAALSIDIGGPLAMLQDMIGKIIGVEGQEIIIENTGKQL